MEKLNLEDFKEILRKYTRSAIEAYDNARGQVADVHTSQDDATQDPPAQTLDPLALCRRASGRRAGCRRACLASRPTPPIEKNALHKKASTTLRTPSPTRLTTLAVIVAIILPIAGCSQPSTQSLSEAAEEGQNQLEQVADQVREKSQADGEGGLSGSGGQTHQVTVSSVTDGDTIEIEHAIDGKTDVRLIGVDTPETFGGEQPYGPQAKQFTTNRLEGKQVRLTLGKDSVDPYGRLLANVSVVGQQRLHAEFLLERGMAQDLFYSPNTANEALFGRIQEDARARQVGIWGLPLSQQCQLEDRGNGIGSGRAAC